MPVPPEPQTGTGADPKGQQKTQSTFAVISSRRCAQPHYSVKDTPFPISTLRRMKARIQTFGASSKSSKTSLTKDSCEIHESTGYPLSYTEGVIHKTAPLNTRIQDRLKAAGACLAESVRDIKDPIPAVTIPVEPPTATSNDTPTTPFDVHTTLLGRTGARYAAARAFNLGLPTPEREGLVGLCDEIPPKEEQGVIRFSLEGTYIPRGVPRGRVTRFVETGVQEEEDVLAVEKEALTIDMATKNRMGARALRNTMRRRRDWGWNCQDQLIKA
ncbi:hypothetical protein V491_03377 [Pseudogymnoascus sp. VKM F-3775]|nr:hypothetical protein V491_03377 [Pseudogymnoascus sp. VKM F-3775]